MNRILAIPALVLALCAAAPLAGSASEDEPRDLAPDGRPGFGQRRGAHALGRLFVSPSEADEALLAGLDELTSDLLVLREMVRRDYRSRGIFLLLEAEEGDALPDLHRRFREDQATPWPVFASGGRRAEVFGELLLDARFQVRTELFGCFDLESRELRAGLALLRGSQDGLYDLKDTEARTVASRLDLTAAILRAVRLDLDVLRERGEGSAPGSPEPAWMAELIGITKLRSEADRLRAFDSLEAKVAGRRERLRSVLFWPRLEGRLRTELARRQAFEDLAARHLERVQRFLVVPPFDEDPPRSVLDLSRADRHRHALGEGLRGLEADPLDEELTYWTAVAADYLYGPQEGRRWFDRYLALRGIRATDHRSTKGRDLNDREEYALEKVLIGLTQPRGPVGR